MLMPTPTTMSATDAEEGTPVSVKIRERLLAARTRFNANDNIADFIEPGELEKLLDEVTVKMQGSRSADFKEANRIAKLHGCRGKPTTTSEKYVHGDVTWHHATYNKKTNTAVMELVTTADHEATFPHAGSVSDFEKAHGVEYGTQEALDKAEELNGTCPCG